MELVKPPTDHKHLDLKRPAAARHHSLFRGNLSIPSSCVSQHFITFSNVETITGQQSPADAWEHGGKGKYTLIRDPEDFLASFDKPLPCFGCGIGWFSFLTGFMFPVMWYYATILYFGNYYRKDPRERAGLAAAAIAAMGCSLLLVLILAYRLLF
ncbi:hypothetical protein LINPERHAP1_LOCUS22084 [Linum perenne]